MFSFETKAKDVFLECCALHGAKKPNSKICDILSNGDVESWIRSFEWDFSDNLLGKTILRAVLDMLPLSSGLKHINLSHNQLTSEDVACILAAVEKHPNIQSIDLSNNPLSIVAARAIHTCIKNTPRITAIGLTGTGLENGEWGARIKKELDISAIKRNRSLSTSNPRNQIYKDSVWVIDTVLFYAHEAAKAELSSMLMNAFDQMNVIAQERCRRIGLLASLTVNSGEATPTASTSSLAVILLGSEDIPSHLEGYFRTTQNMIVVYAEVSQTPTPILKAVQDKVNIRVFYYEKENKLLLRFQSDLWNILYEPYVKPQAEFSTVQTMTVRQNIHRSNTLTSTGLFPRTHEIDELTNYCINTGEITVPMVLYGASGIGSTSLLSMAAERLESHSSKVRVVSYFFQTFSDTSSVVSFVFDVLFGLLGDKNFTRAVSGASMGDLMNLMFIILRDWDQYNPSPEMTTVLLVGGWSRCEPVKSSPNKYEITSWLPAVLPSTLRIVVSMDTGNPSLQRIRRRKPLPLELRVSNLNPKQALTLLKLELGKRGKELPEDLQLGLNEPGHFDVAEGIIDKPTTTPRELISKQDAHLPFYMRLLAAKISLSVESGDRFPGTLQGLTTSLFLAVEQRFGTELVRLIFGILCATYGSELLITELTATLKNIIPVASLLQVHSLVHYMKELSLVVFTAECCLQFSHPVVLQACLKHFAFTDEDLDGACVALSKWYAYTINMQSKSDREYHMFRLRGLIRHPIVLLRCRQISEVLQHISSNEVMQRSVDYGLLYQFLNVVFLLKNEMEYLKEIGAKSLESHQFRKNHAAAQVEVTFNDLIHSCAEISRGVPMLQLGLLMPLGSLLHTSAIEYVDSHKAGAGQKYRPMLYWTNRKEEDRSSVFTVQNPAPCVHCDISKDAVLFVVTTANSATVYATETQEILHMIESTTGAFLGSYFIHDKPDTPTRLVTVLREGILLWDLSGESEELIDGYTASLRRQAITTNGKKIVAINVELKNTAVLIDLAERKPVASFEPLKDDEIREAHFALHCDVAMIIGTYEIQIHRSGQPPVSLNHDSFVTRACISNDAAFAVAACEENMYLWKTINGTLLYKLNHHISEINDIVFHPTGQVLMSSSKDGMVCVWSVINGEVVHEFHCGKQKGGVASLNPEFASFTGDGMRILTRCGNVVRVYDSISWGDLGMCIGHTGRITYLSTAKDVVITVDAIGEAKKWSMLTGLPSYTSYHDRHYLSTKDIRKHTTAHASAIAQISYSNHMLATLTTSSELSLWPLDSTNQECVCLNKVSSVWVPPNGQFILCTMETEILVFETLSAVPTKRMNLADVKGLQGSFTSVTHATANEGLLAVVLVGANISNRIVVVHMESGELVTQLCAHTKHITGMYFLNADTLVTCSLDQTVRTWGVHTHTQWAQWEASSPIQSMTTFGMHAALTFVGTKQVQLLTVLGRSILTGQHYEMDSQVLSTVIIQEDLLMAACADGTLRMLSISKNHGISMVSIVKSPYGIPQCLSAGRRKDEVKPLIVVGDSYGHAFLYHLCMVSVE